MSGRLHSETANFSKPKYTLYGITGDIQLFFDREKLVSLCFWTDGSDGDFAKLYQVLVRACGSPGTRTVNGPDDSEINWIIAGATNQYDVQLSHQRWESKLSNSVKVERGMTVLIKNPAQDSRAK